MKIFMLIILLLFASIAEATFICDEPALYASNSNIDLTKKVEEFKSKHFSSSKPTLIYFKAKWCSFCKAFTPTVLKAEKKFKDVKFVYIEVTENGNITYAKAFGIRAYPAVIIFKDGKGFTTYGLPPSDEAFYKHISRYIKGN